MAAIMATSLKTRNAATETYGWQRGGEGAGKKAHQGDLSEVRGGRVGSDIAAKTVLYCPCPLCPSYLVHPAAARTPAAAGGDGVVDEALVLHVLVVVMRGVGAGVHHPGCVAYRRVVLMVPPSVSGLRRGAVAAAAAGTPGGARGPAPARTVSGHFCRTALTDVHP